MDILRGQKYLQNKKLNQKQLEAVMDFSHDLLILSTAGSGKTRVITEKVAFALNYMGYDPSSILALTFTRKAADEMQSRIDGLCKGRNLDGLTISTFHAYGKTLIDKYLPGEYELLDDNDQIAFVQNLFNMRRKKAEDISDRIATVKDNGIPPRDIAIDEKELPDDFPELYSSYERELHAQNLLDFADLIIEAINILDSKETIREKLHRKYKLILVDEYQDTNLMQDIFLKKLKGPDCQLVIVGDDDQGIYGFRGARVDNIRQYYQNRAVRTIALDLNYRSTRAIVEFAEAIINQSPERIAKNICTSNAYGVKPFVFASADPDAEAEDVIKLIKQNPETDTAILARTNAKVNRFIYPLLKENLSVDVSDNISYLLRSDYIKRTYALLKLLDNPGDEDAFISFLYGTEHLLSEEDVISICMHSSDLNFIEGMSKALNMGRLSRTASDWAASFLEFYRNGLKLKDSAYSQAFDNAVIGMVLGKDALKDPKKTGMISRISDFLSLRGTCFVSSGCTRLKDFIAAFRHPSAREEKHIHLMTIHKAKGLEFDRVFIVDVNDDVLPLDKAETDEEIEEERRLFYVAATRAKEQLFISFVEKDSKGNDSIPSVFLQSIPQALYDGMLDESDEDEYESWVAEEYGSANR